MVKKKLRYLSFITINEPFIVGADDYHEFGHLKDLLEQLTERTVRYEELEVDHEREEVYVADVMLDNSTYYYAVFYRTGLWDSAMARKKRFLEGEE